MIRLAQVLAAHVGIQASGLENLFLLFTHKTKKFRPVSG